MFPSISIQDFSSSQGRWQEVQPRGEHDSRKGALTSRTRALRTKPLDGRYAQRPAAFVCISDSVASNSYLTYYEPDARLRRAPDSNTVRSSVTSMKVPRWHSIPISDSICGTTL